MPESKMAEKFFNSNYSLAERFKNSDIKLTRREQLAVRKKYPMKHLNKDEREALVGKVRLLDMETNRELTGDFSTDVNFNARKRTSDFVNYLIYKHFSTDKEMTEYYRNSVLTDIGSIVLVMRSPEKTCVYNLAKISDLKQMLYDKFEHAKKSGYFDGDMALEERALGMEKRNPTI